MGNRRTIVRAMTIGLLAKDHLSANPVKTLLKPGKNGKVSKKRTFMDSLRSILRPDSKN